MGSVEGDADEPKEGSDDESEYEREDKVAAEKRRDSTMKSMLLSFKKKL